MAYHLKRIGPQSSRNGNVDFFHFHKRVITIGRNPNQVDYVINSANFVQNSIISRRHARVVTSDDKIKLFDDSRNGVFVNDRKIDGEIILNEGDTVTFGHPNGEKLLPGHRARQPDSEYQFMFEVCQCKDKKEKTNADFKVPVAAPLKSPVSKQDAKKKLPESAMSKSTGQLQSSSTKTDMSTAEGNHEVVPNSSRGSNLKTRTDQLKERLSKASATLSSVLSAPKQNAAETVEVKECVKDKEDIQNVKGAIEEKETVVETVEEKEHVEAEETEENNKEIIEEKEKQSAQESEPENDSTTPVTERNIKCMPHETPVAIMQSYETEDVKQTPGAEEIQKELSESRFVEKNISTAEDSLKEKCLVESKMETEEDKIKQTLDFADAPHPEVNEKNDQPEQLQSKASPAWSDVFSVIAQDSGRVINTDEVEMQEENKSHNDENAKDIMEEECMDEDKHEVLLSCSQEYDQESDNVSKARQLENDHIAESKCDVNNENKDDGVSKGSQPENEHTEDNKCDLNNENEHQILPSCSQEYDQESVSVSKESRLEEKNVEDNKCDVNKENECDNDEQENECEDVCNDDNVSLHIEEQSDPGKSEELETEEIKVDQTGNNDTEKEEIIENSSDCHKKVINEEKDSKTEEMQEKAQPIQSDENGKIAVEPNENIIEESEHECDISAVLDDDIEDDNGRVHDPEFYDLQTQPCVNDSRCEEDFDKSIQAENDDALQEFGIEDKNSEPNQGVDSSHEKTKDSLMEKKDDGPVMSIHDMETQPMGMDSDTEEENEVEADVKNAPISTANKLMNIHEMETQPMGMDSDTEEEKQESDNHGKEIKNVTTSQADKPMNIHEMETQPMGDETDDDTDSDDCNDIEKDKVGDMKDKNEHEKVKKAEDKCHVMNIHEMETQPMGDETDDEEAETERGDENEAGRNKDCEDKVNGKTDQEKSRTDDVLHSDDEYEPVESGFVEATKLTEEEVALSQNAPSEGQFSDAESQEIVTNKSCYVLCHESKKTDSTFSKPEDKKVPGNKVQVLKKIEEENLGDVHSGIPTEQEDQFSLFLNISQDSIALTPSRKSSAANSCDLNFEDAKEGNLENETDLNNKQQMNKTIPEIESESIEKCEENYADELRRKCEGITSPEDENNVEDLMSGESRLLNEEEADDSAKTKSTNEIEAKANVTIEEGNAVESENEAQTKLLVEKEAEDEETLMAEKEMQAEEGKEEERMLEEERDAEEERLRAEKEEEERLRAEEERLRAEEEERLRAEREAEEEEEERLREEEEEERLRAEEEEEEERLRAEREAREEEEERLRAEEEEEERLRAEREAREEEEERLRAEEEEEEERLREEEEERLRAEREAEEEEEERLREEEEEERLRAEEEEEEERLRAEEEEERLRAEEEEDEEDDYGKMGDEYESKRCSSDEESEYNDDCSDREDRWSKKRSYSSDEDDLDSEDSRVKRKFTEDSDDNEQESRSEDEGSDIISKRFSYTSSEEEQDDVEPGNLSDDCHEEEEESGVWTKEYSDESNKEDESDVRSKRSHDSDDDLEDSEIRSKRRCYNSSSDIDEKIVDVEKSMETLASTRDLNAGLEQNKSEEIVPNSQDSDSLSPTIPFLNKCYSGNNHEQESRQKVDEYGVKNTEISANLEHKSTDNAARNRDPRRESPLEGLSCDFDDDGEFVAPTINMDCLSSQGEGQKEPSVSPTESSSNKENLSQISTPVSASQSNTTTPGSHGRVAAMIQRLKEKKSIKKEIKKEPGLDSSQSTQETPGTQLKDIQTKRRILGDGHGSNVQMDNVETYGKRICDILTNMRQIFIGRRDLHSIQRVKGWVDEMAKLTRNLKSPKTTIAVVGDTGAGKSSLMNALLDHADVLPTSGMRACTAVVVEITANKKNDKFEADIDFLSKKEWYDELKLLLTELTGRDGFVKAYQPDPKSEAGVAWSKIRSVYGKFKDGDTFETFARMKQVTRWLDERRTISETNPKMFRRIIDKYIESSDSGDGGQYWPIVKHVTLRIPNCDVLSSGATLVDLPGIRDSNAARDKIAKEFLKNCSAVFVVASIHRAIDDKTAKDLLGEHFKRQLLMDGQYGSVTFVCTKTDILNPSEIIRALDLSEKTKEHEDKIADCEHDQQRCRDYMMPYEEEIESLNEQLQGLISEKEEFENDRAELEQLTQEEVDEEERKEAQIHIDDFTMNIMKKEEEISKIEGEIGRNQEKIDENNQMIQEEEIEIAKQRKIIAAICAKGRNEYSKGQIKKDFKAGLREMKRKASRSAEEIEEEQDDDYAEDLEGDEEIGSSANNLKVFCASSTEFLKLRKKLPKDGPPQVFSDIADTGIPGMREYIHEITQRRQVEGTERQIKSVGQFVYDIYNYLCDEGTEDDLERGKAKDVFMGHFLQLKSEFLQPLLEGIDNQIEKTFNESLKPKLQQGTALATNLAENTVAKWGNKVNKENRSAGGLHYSTYKAVVRRDGVYRSPTAGPIDFNEELSGPVYTAITISWDHIFNSLLWRQLENLKNSVIKGLRKFSLELNTELQLVGMSTERIQRVSQQQITSANNKLSETIQGVKEFIGERQREISRVITPTVQGCMGPAYQLSTEEKGPGSFNRMRNHMGSHIRISKSVTFDQASVTLLNGLMELQKDIMQRLTVMLETLEADVKQQYEPFWEAPINTRVLREAYFDGVTKCKDMVRDLFLDSNIKIEEHKPATVTKKMPTKSIVKTPTATITKGMLTNPAPKIPAATVTKSMLANITPKTPTAAIKGKIAVNQLQTTQIAFINQNLVPGQQYLLPAGTLQPLMGTSTQMVPASGLKQSTLSYFCKNNIAVKVEKPDGKKAKPSPVIPGNSVLRSSPQPNGNLSLGKNKGKKRASIATTSHVIKIKDEPQSPGTKKRKKQIQNDEVIDLTKENGVDFDRNLPSIKRRSLPY